MKLHNPKFSSDSTVSLRLSVSRRAIAVSGNVLSKSDVISWAMSGDINEEKSRIVYENDEIGVHHAFVTFKDGNTQAVMAVYKFKDGKIFSLETGATNMPK